MVVEPGEIVHLDFSEIDLCPEVDSDGGDGDRET